DRREEVTMATAETAWRYQEPQIGSQPLRVHDVARRMGVHVLTALLWVTSGQLEALDRRTGSTPQWRINEASLPELIKRRGIVGVRIAELRAQLADLDMRRAELIHELGRLERTK